MTASVLQEQDLAVLFADTLHLSQRLHAVVHTAETERVNNRVEGLVVKRQGVGAHDLQVARGDGLLGFAGDLIEHSAAEIRQRQLRVLGVEREVPPRARRHFQDASSGVAKQEAPHERKSHQRLVEIHVFVVLGGVAIKHLESLGVRHGVHRILGLLRWLVEGQVRHGRRAHVHGRAGEQQARTLEQGLQAHEQRVNASTMVDQELHHPTGIVPIICLTDRITGICICHQRGIEKLTSMTKRSGATLYATLLAGAALRALLYAWGGVQSTLSARPELVTAVSSFRRVQEAVFLYETQGSPYAGDVFHQPPLVFAAFYPILSLPDKFQYAAACAFFIAVDLLIAWGLVRLCERTHELGEAQVPTHDGDEIWLNKVPMSPVFSDKHLPHTVAFIYLFNPYSLASSVAMATTSLTHLTVLYSLVFAASGALVAATLCLATATYLSVYPALLVVPVAVMLRASHPARANRSPFLAISSTVQLLVVWLAALLYLSKSLGGDWEFIEETYVWVAKYSDLTPNVGVFWYFFIEVFDRFIPYFLLVLHIHPLIYVAPMYLRLSHRPQVYACVLFGIASLFQAYPSFGDFGFFLVMMAVHPKTIMTVKYRYVYVLGLAVATCMLPVMWFLWLFPASGNANFFYNQTLVYQIFNSQVITAFVGATMKRDKDVQIFRKRLAEDAKKKSE